MNEIKSKKKKMWYCSMGNNRQPPTNPKREKRNPERKIENLFHIYYPQSSPNSLAKKSSSSSSSPPSVSPSVSPSSPSSSSISSPTPSLGVVALLLLPSVTFPSLFVSSSLMTLTPTATPVTPRPLVPPWGRTSAAEKASLSFDDPLLSAAIFLRLARGERRTSESLRLPALPSEGVTLRRRFRLLRGVEVVLL